MVDLILDNNTKLLQREATPPPSLVQDSDEAPLSFQERAALANDNPLYVAAKIGMLGKRGGGEDRRKKRKGGNGIKWERRVIFFIVTFFFFSYSSFSSLSHFPFPSLSSCRTR